jgi:hypothetical protein
MRLAIAFALAGQQLDRAHFAHVHAHRVGGATELAVDRGQRRGGFLGGLVVGGDCRVSLRLVSVSVRVSCTEMPMSLIMLTMSSICSGSTMSVGQVVVDLRIGQEALLLA